jgi:hypothetical protein
MVLGGRVGESATLSFSVTADLSQDSHYKFCGFHGCDYEEWRLLGMLRRVALVRTDVSEKLSAFFIRVTESMK